VDYTLVDGYGSTQEITLPNGQTFPAPSLIEGDESIRVLIALGETLPVKLWADAATAGADVIYRQDTHRMSYVLADEFNELAALNEAEAVYTLPEFIWHPGVPEELFGPQEPTQAREEASDASDERRDSAVRNESSSVPVPDVRDEARSVDGDGPPGDRDDTFVHLHAHSEYSALDGLPRIQEMVDVAVRQGHSHLAVTDHGVVSGHYDLEKMCVEAGINPVFGMEAYLVTDRHSREGGNDYQHLNLWAIDDEGLQNLWAISTEGYRDGLYNDHPRIDYDTLRRLNKGVMASSTCLRGPLTEPYLRGKPAEALSNLAKLMEIFDDRFYMEIHCNQLEPQIRSNEWLVKIAREFDVPMIVAVDSHYAEHDQRDDHQVWISSRTGKDVSDESSMFGGGQDYHMADAAHVRKSLAYLGDDVTQECMDNSVKLAERCTARMKKINDMPSYTGTIDGDREKVWAVIEENWDRRTLGKPYSQEEAQARFEHEWVVMDPKNYWGYFLQNWDLVNYAKSHGVLVGPGRGSGAGCFIAYLMGIVETDALEHDLMFERFMTKGRTSLPDFDIDYPSSKKQFMIDYAVNRWGKTHVCAIGTQSRIKNKGAFKDTARAIASRLPEGYFTDVEKISKLITQAEASTAGLGMKWDELMDTVGADFDVYKEKYPYLFEMAQKFRGRLKTYSRHAAGLVIAPQHNLEGTLPMFLAPDGKTLVTQFDMNVLEELGYVKFDFLNLRNLDTIQDTVDLVREQLGVEIDVNMWREEYKDASVFDDISHGWTLGMFQVETQLGTRTVKQLRPENLGHLADCITLGRPGPIRSGLDRTYFRRREGKEKVTVPDPRLLELLNRTYGTMIYQEDIMGICRILAGYTDDEADKVRKILGKKKIDEAKAAGATFITRATENDTNNQVAIELWEQMEEFSRYSFNRAHAFAYATLAYWTAWLKHYYPGQFMTACLSTIDMEDVPPFVSEARRLGYKVLPPDVNDSKIGFTSRADSNVIRYGLESIKGIGNASSKAIMENQPYASFEDFLDRKGEKANMGHVRTLVHIGAFDSLIGNRKALEARLAEEDMKNSERCIFFQLQPRNKYNDLPCGFDWDSLPFEYGKPLKDGTRKKLKVQAKRQPPKICSKACKQWTPRPLPSDEEVEPYTDAEIREIEMQALGIYLSSSPFDIIDPEDLEQLATADELQVQANGRYMTVMLISRIKEHTTRKGDPMMFMTVATPSGSMDVTVFNDTMNLYRDDLKVGTMAFAEVTKNDKGVTLNILEAL
jgi:DNA polymerase-3 subunit alpha